MGGLRAPLAPPKGGLGGYPPKGPLGPQKGPKNPLFCANQGGTLGWHIYVRVSVRKMPFSTLKFPRASENRGKPHIKGPPDLVYGE